jgi:hypothetical protein
MSIASAPMHMCACPICQAGTDATVRQQHAHINLLLSRLTEPQRRWYVAVLSEAPDAPSDRHLALLTGLNPETIRRGRANLAAGLAESPPLRQRRAGGGRRATEKKSPL